jgi:hypothetical protein
MIVYDTTVTKISKLLELVGNIYPWHAWAHRSRDS